MDLVDLADFTRYSSPIARTGGCGCRGITGTAHCARPIHRSSHSSPAPPSFRLRLRSTRITRDLHLILLLLDGLFAFCRRRCTARCRHAEPRLDRQAVRHDKVGFTILRVDISKILCNLLSGASRPKMEILTPKFLLSGSTCAPPHRPYPRGIELNRPTARGKGVARHFILARPSP